MGSDDMSCKCSVCGEIFHMADLAYLGPKDPKDESCSPHTEIVAICKECYVGMQFPTQ